MAFEWYYGVGLGIIWQEVQVLLEAFALGCLLGAFVLNSLSPVLLFVLSSGIWGSTWGSNLVTAKAFELQCC